MTNPRRAPERVRLDVALKRIAATFRGVAAHPNEYNCECHWGGPEELAQLKVPDVELDRAARVCGHAGGDALSVFLVNQQWRDVQAWPLPGSARTATIQASTDVEVVSGWMKRDRLRSFHDPGCL
ncbi:hypothetical protein [Micromonospora sp. DT47]|uniref:hypothetical protein n=1 Tax=Micromonospora sp. DT47 TaxID=3393431 RepID=UPI003CF4F49B